MPDRPAQADLLSATMALPFTVQVALPLARDELSSFREEDWQRSPTSVSRSSTSMASALLGRSN
jgi:hypothetical protein